LIELPEGPPAEELAGLQLARRGRPGDIVLVDSPYRLNRLLYYAERAGARGVSMRCVLRRDSVGRGHVPHLASLVPGDIAWSDALERLPGRRFWWGSISNGPWLDAPEDWMPVSVRTFRGGGETRYTLTRYRKGG
jgi:hypothetical protein